MADFTADRRARKHAAAPGKKPAPRSREKIIHAAGDTRSVSVKQGETPLHGLKRMLHDFNGSLSTLRSAIDRLAPQPKAPVRREEQTPLKAPVRREELPSLATGTSHTSSSTKEIIREPGKTEHTVEHRVTEKHVSGKDVSKQTHSREHATEKRVEKYELKNNLARDRKDIALTPRAEKHVASISAPAASRITAQRLREQKLTGLVGAPAPAGQLPLVSGTAPLVIGGKAVYPAAVTAQSRAAGGTVLPTVSVRVESAAASKAGLSSTRDRVPRLYPSKPADSIRTGPLPDFSFDRRNSQAQEFKKPRGKTPRGRSIRMPSISLAANKRTRVNMSAGDMRQQKMVSGADREAYRQVVDGAAPHTPEGMPSAARLAQILHADELIKAGEGKPQPLIHALAQAVREGRRREAADVDPAVVQAALETAMGGATRVSQMLNTPGVAGMVERYQTSSELIHRDLKEREVRMLKRSGRSAVSASRARHDRAPSGSFPGAAGFMGSAPSSIRSGSASHTGSSSRANADAPDSTSDRADVPSDLATMLATNEEPHRASIADRERMMYDRDISQMDGPPARERQIGSVSAKGGGIASGITAPAPNPSRSAGGAQENEKSGGGGKRVRLEGEMKITSANGQSAGTGSISGLLVE